MILHCHWSFLLDPVENRLSSWVWSASMHTRYQLVRPPANLSLRLGMILHVVIWSKCFIACASQWETFRLNPIQLRTHIGGSVIQSWEWTDQNKGSYLLESIVSMIVDCEWFCAVPYPNKFRFHCRQDKWNTWRVTKWRRYGTQHSQPYTKFLEYIKHRKDDSIWGNKWILYVIKTLVL